MRNSKLLYALSFLLLTSILLAANLSKIESNENTGPAPSELSFDKSDSEENFNKMMDVLTHQRCMNCHPSDNVPKQGEDSHPHYFGMERGKDNLGYAATNCNTCHQHENNDYSGVPGAPEWSLAPQSMKWEGLSRVEIAESMLDKKRNGNRTPHEVMEHLTEHALVLWAWTPGVTADGTPREKPPVPVDEYIEAVKEWFEAGAVIPGK